MTCSKNVLWLMGGLLLGGASLAKGNPAAPFVAGFDRFARHEEIDPTVGGRLLLTELSCTACHATKAEHLQPKRGPRLTGAGNRLQADWIKRFLSAPQHTKPGTTMPDVFAGWPEAEKGQAIEDLLAFLGSQREAYPVLKASGLNPVPFEFWKRGRAERGKRLYHQVGCVACHEADPDYETVETKPSSIDQLLEQLDPQELKELGLAGKARRVESVPHGNLAAKYTHKSLTFFLLDPEKSRPAGRMPGLKLKAVEAADIAAYLLREQSPQVANQTPANLNRIKKGRKLFAELRCINCHEVAGLKADQSAKPLEALTASAGKTCVDKPLRGLPHFALDAVQTAAMGAALETNQNGKLPVRERLGFSLLQLNCYACHEHDQQGGVGRYRKSYFETVGHVDIGDEGRLPPPLTGVGGKLQMAWMNQVFQGKSDIRPHMRIRMPEFPSRVTKPLPGWFAEAVPPNQKVTEHKGFGSLAGLAKPGRLLMDQGCVQCHQFRGEALPGVVGVDLEGITKRVRPEWFHDFLLNPANLKPRTRMPTFFPNGESQNKQVLAGDTERQIAAMWAYLKELDKQPLPEKIEEVRSQDYELKPQDRPIVLRTFMKEAGTHAVAVGFPQQVHFAFDAETSRLAVAWRVRFLDAQGTWFSRFTPPADPLGEDFIKLPEDLPFALLKEANPSWPKADPLNPTYRYLGYRLDEEGVPTFLYRYDRFDIEDRIAPHGDRQLKRVLTLKNRKPKRKVPDLLFKALPGKTVEHQKDFTFTDEAGLTAKISKTIGHAGELRQNASTGEWVIRFVIPTEQTIELQYKW